MLSIIITTNNVKYIEETVNSIYNQLFLPKEYEILIGIDGCEQCAKEILNKSFVKDTEHVFIFNFKENKGTYITRNTLIKESYGDELLLFDSDDVMFPNMIEVIYKYKKKYDVIRFQFNQINIKGNKHTFEPNYDVYAAGVFFMKKYVWNYLGGFKSWRFSADTDFHHRVDKSEKYFVKFINEQLFLYRMWEKNLTNKIPIKNRLEKKNEMMYDKKIINVPEYHKDFDVIN